MVLTADDLYWTRAFVNDDTNGNGEYQDSSNLITNTHPGNLLPHQSGPITSKATKYRKIFLYNSMGGYTSTAYNPKIWIESQPSCPTCEIFIRPADNVSTQGTYNYLPIGTFGITCTQNSTEYHLLESSGAYDARWQIVPGTIFYPGTCSTFYAVAQSFSSDGYTIFGNEWKAPTQTDVPIFFYPITHAKYATWYQPTSSVHADVLTLPWSLGDGVGSPFSMGVWVKVVFDPTPYAWLKSEYTIGFTADDA